MAESKQYLLGNERYVTVNISENTSEIYKINSDGTKTIYADSVDGKIEPSGFASEDFKKNLSSYKSTINSSIQDAKGLPPQQVTDPNQPGVAGGSTPTNPNPQQPEQPASQDFRYPVDMLRTQDTIKFTCVEYIAPGFGETGQARKGKQRKITGTATLPIQAQITDGNRADWKSGSLDDLTRRGLSAATGLVKNELTQEKLRENINTAISEFTDKSNTNQILALLAEGTVAKGENIQGRFGGILNPNVELLFSGPSLRGFGFNIKMSPRSSTESTQVKSIIRFFKKNMAPKLDNQLFLKAPNTFLIEYQGAGERGLNKIKECALVECNVNYTPQGSYMTYEDGTMVSYYVQLSFQEIEPVYDVDYQEDHPIGF